MPQIPIETPLEYVTVAFILLGMFFIVTGLGLIKIKNITVKVGKSSIVFGVTTFLLGIIFLLLTTTKPTEQQVGNTPSQTDSEQAVILLAKAKNWTVGLQDTFDSNSSKWKEGDYDSSSATYSLQISSGTYSWQMQAKTDGALILMPATIEPHSSFYVSVDAKGIEGINNLAYGIAFRSEGTTKYYNFRLYPQKSWFSVKYREKIIDLDETLIYYPSNQIHENDWNKIQIVAIDTEYWFYINDVFVSRMSSDKYSGGIVGLIVAIEKTGQEAKVEFDNFDFRYSP